jgi:hypothetical protein
MSDRDIPLYHRWSARQRWWFECLIQLLLVLVIAGGVWECVGPLPKAVPCPPTSLEVH